MNYGENFKSELVNLNLNVNNQKQFFQVISNDLKEKGYVVQTFKEAIIEREKMYPTGLQLENFAIAIPHTDVVHIQHPFVAVYRLKKAINFYQMGTDDVIVPVKDVLVLGINEPKKQVGLLSNLMQCFSKNEFVKKYKNITTSDSVIELIKNNL
ncbi:PTS sugar transporter subunit IIA [Tetragenococcus halophilus]|uniref:Phosphotransferase system enzyme IIA component n=1 Tax=Tetragenococcus halophilus (strain DSM 20338 / JCM 20259 / NCIMB 9735 / NBRC 12172) TaxID=945021 RepID=A0AAN1SI44_TETHN|nr:PTS sugar transporter subunit IIA [Tetragenococcus halophilus]BAK95410.1 putative phosphotransferase system enzyme IIA component [Tetragenococcus halophilus NBRC 12172]GBD70394.1 putative phosphotransferase system enzyme IIA component [Tetragenococcus halophilus subsp. halophilus]